MPPSRPRERSSQALDEAHEEKALAKTSNPTVFRDCVELAETRSGPLRVAIPETVYRAG